MISTTNLNPNPKKCDIERLQPSVVAANAMRTLKDFLDDDITSNSCSSSGFTSLPRRKPPHPPAPATLPRSRSRSRAAVSSFQKLLLSAVRSLKRRRQDDRNNHANKVKVKVKDILRWGSSRGVAVVEGPTTTTRSSSSSISSNSSSASWGNNDDEDSKYSFTAEELPCWWAHGQLLGEGGKKWKVDHDHVDVGEDSGRGTTVTTTVDVGPKDNVASEEDKEQQSPVSVLNSPFRDEISDDEFVSSFDQSLANVERTKQRLLQGLEWLESLVGVEEQSSNEEEEEEEEDSGTEQEQEQEQEEQLEETTERNQDNNATEEAKNRVYLMRALVLLQRAGHSVKDKEECVTDMQREAQWSKFDEDKEELGVELEACMMHDLVDEVLFDLFLFG